VPCSHSLGIASRHVLLSRPSVNSIARRQHRSTVESRLHSRCRILTNSTKHCSCLTSNWYTVNWRIPSKRSNLLDSGPLATWSGTVLAQENLGFCSRSSNPGAYFAHPRTPSVNYHAVSLAAFAWRCHCGDQYRVLWGNHHSVLFHLFARGRRYYAALTTR